MGRGQGAVSPAGLGPHLHTRRVESLICRLCLSAVLNGPWGPNQELSSSPATLTASASSQHPSPPHPARRFYLVSENPAAPPRPPQGPGRLVSSPRMSVGSEHPRACMSTPPSMEPAGSRLGQVPTEPGPPGTPGSSHLLCQHQPHWVRAHPGHTLPLCHLFKGPSSTQRWPGAGGVRT